MSCRPPHQRPAFVPSHLIVHQYDPREQLAGGIHGFITDLIRLAPEGHDFRVVGVDASGGRTIGKWEQVTVGTRDVGFLPVARFSAGDERRFVPHTVRLVAGLLARRPHESRSTYLHAHRVEVGAALHLVHRWNRLVQFVHTDSAEAARHRAESFWRFMPRLHDAIERSTVRSAYRTWVLNRAAAARLAETGADRVRYGRNWFDEELFYPAGGTTGASGVVAWIGRLEPSKDPVRAVEAIAALRADGHEASLWIAGSGSLEGAVRAAIRERGLDGSVELLGTLAPEALAERLRRTRALLVTSLWEGQPRAVLEALACGVAVVAPAVGDIPEVVRQGRTGFVASSHAPAELAQLLARVEELPPPAALARSVDGFRGSAVVRAFFDDLEAPS